MLSWSVHIDTLIKRLNMYICWFYKVRHLCTALSNRQLYFAYIHSSLMYGLLLYGNANLTNIKRLQVVHNRSLRVLQNVPYLTPRTDLYHNFNTMSICNLFNLEIYKLLFNCVHNNNNMPNDISQIFSNHFTHSYNTRGQDHNFIYRDMTAQISCFYPLYANKFISLWNNLPQSTRNCVNFNAFIKLCKTSILY